jgi:hypothetical protein
MLREEIEQSRCCMAADRESDHAGQRSTGSRRRDACRNPSQQHAHWPCTWTQAITISGPWAVIALPMARSGASSVTR